MPERRYLVASAIVVLLLALLPLAGSRYAVDLATEVLIYVLFALSLNVIIGFTGNISFGHAAYFAIGGYACAILLTTYGWPLVASLPAAVVLAGLVAAVVGYFCVRLTQIYFAMLTLAFAMLVWGICFKWKEVTGGDDGFTGIKLPAMLAHHVGYFYFTLAVVAAGVAALWVICHSAFGLTLVAVRENGVRAGFIGVDTRRMRWAAFTVAGTFGGLAGALFGMYHRGMYIENAFWTELAQVLIMVLLGGIYSFVGPILGAAVLYLLQVFTNQYTIYWPTVLGLILLVIVLVLPDGLIGLVAARRRARGRANERHAAHRGPVEVVRRLRRHARRLVRPEGGRAARHHRPQRRRQDHLLQSHHRTSAARQGRRVVRGPRPGRPAAAQDRAAGHRPVVPAHQHLSQAHRVRERAGGADRARKASSGTCSAPAARCTAREPRNCWSWWAWRPRPRRSAAS